MKKSLIFALTLVATTASIAFCQEDGNRPARRPGGNFLAQARTEDGKIDLSKLPEQMPQERKDAMKNADKDGDGFLTQEELREAMPGRGERPNQGRPGEGFGGPQGGPGMGPMGPMGPMGFGGGPMGPAMQDGKLDLSKLPEQMPQERKDAMKKADKDGDGFLTQEELREAFPRPKFQFPEGKKPDFVNDDSGIVIDKLVEAIKSFDKDNDGVVSVEEQGPIAEAIQKEFGPSFNMFVQYVIGAPFGMGQPGFGMGQPGFGMGQPGFGFGGPQRTPPQGQPGQRGRGGFGPQGNRGGNR